MSKNLLTFPVFYEKRRSQRSLFEYFYSLTSESFESICTTLCNDVEYYDIVYKLNHHKKKNKRFVIVTGAALYVCKVYKMLRSVKISNAFSWINLNRMVCKNIPNQNNFDNQFSLFFNNKTLTLMSASINTLIEKIIVNLYQLFGEEFPVKMEIESLDLNVLSKQKTVFSKLFASYCIAMELPINNIIYNELLTMQNNESEFGLIIDMHSFKNESKYMIPILNTIKYVRKIYKLSVVGTEINNVFEYLSEIVDNNKNSLQIISIDQISSFQGIDVLYHALLRSKISTLIFNGINFPESFNVSFTEFMKQSVVTSLCFDNCNFYENTFQQFQNHLNAFENLVSFQLYNTNFLKNKEIFRDFFAFISLTKLSDLKLVNINIDISHIFNILDSKTMPLITLDLSQNRCTDLSGTYDLPITLSEINLSFVQWDKKSLINLLTNQKYINCIFLNVSSIVGSAFSKVGCLKPKLSAQCIRKLSWNHNVLNTIFIEFISLLENLESLEINGCDIPNNPSDPITPKLAAYFGSCRLREVSMCGSETRTYKNCISEFFAVFSAMPSLESLSITDNGIGDNGVECIVRVCERNSSIRRIEFGGSDLKNPNVFIQCCSALSQLSSIECVGSCSRDIQQLRTHSTDPSEVDAVWEKLMHITAQNRHRRTKEAMVLRRCTDNIMLSATWDIEVPLPHCSERSAWDALSKGLSLTELTGITQNVH